PALNGHSISLTSGELVIDKNISINGPAPQLLTVARSQTELEFGIVHITPGRTVAIQGLTISGGSAPKFTTDPGSGIFNEQGTLTIDRCTVSSNVSFYGGGGILNTGSLTVSYSTISGNFGGFTGGGIENSGILTISDSTIRDNWSGIGPGVGVSTGYGGGISSSGMATISYSTISDNKADGGTLSGSSIGGGIANSG